MRSVSGLSTELAAQLGLSPFVFSEVVRRVAALQRLDRALVYGSRARGDYRTHSDIDIALVGRGLTSQDRIALLFSLEDSPVLFDVDLVLFDQLSPDNRMRDEITRDGVVIYERALAPA